MSLDQLPALPEQTLRRAEPAKLIEVLKASNAQTIDYVGETNGIRLYGGNLMVGGLDEIVVPGRPAALTANGVTEATEPFQFDPSGLYWPTRHADQDIASLFDIPLAYVRRLRSQDTQLLDYNVNRWAEKAEGHRLFRLLYGTSESNPGTIGTLRTIRSDRFGMYDHLDTTMSIFSGLTEGGLSIDNIREINLSEERLYLDIEAPEIAVHGRSLIENYRSPFTGQTGAELPLVHAGVRFVNSEIGRGALEAIPYAIFEVCSNGATINAHKLRRVHIGKQLEPGQVRWSADTVKAANELVAKQVRDAVSSFLTTDFLNGVIDDWERDAGVEVIKPAETIKVIGKELAYTETEQDAILSAFIKGGSMDAFAVGHAVTAAVQGFEDPDRVHDVGSTHLQAVQIAARVATKVEV